MPTPVSATEISAMPSLIALEEVKASVSVAAGTSIVVEIAPSLRNPRPPGAIEEAPHDLAKVVDPAGLGAGSRRRHQWWRRSRRLSETRGFLSHQRRSPRSGRRR